MSNKNVSAMVINMKKLPLRHSSISIVRAAVFRAREKIRRNMLDASLEDDIEKRIVAKVISGERDPTKLVTFALMRIVK